MADVWRVRRANFFRIAVLAAAPLATAAVAAELSGTFRGENVEFGVEYYAGGVGHSAEEEAAERSPDYSVRVLFATPGRALLGNVGLVVTDTEGRVVFRIEGADPIIYLGLPPGTYAFEGSYHGAAHRDPRVVVERGRRRGVVFTFPE